LNIFIKKLVKYSSIFYKLRNKLPSSCLRSIYYAFVHPHILYGIEIYANTFSTYLKPLNVLNNKLLRIFQNCRLQTPVAHLYREYQTLPINQLFILQILTLVHTFFTVIMSYLKFIEIILLLIALFIAIAPDKRVICISVVFKNQLVC